MVLAREKKLWGFFVTSWAPGSVGARGTHEVLAPVPVRGVDRRGVRESAAAMGCWSVGQAGRVDRVTASASREAGSGGSDWRASSGAPERRAVHGLAEVGDGHVVGLSEGRGCLDLEVRGLNRERGQRARWRPRRRTRRRARTRGAPRSPTFFSEGDRGCSSLTWRREVAVRPSRGGLASEAASSGSTTGRSRRGSRPRRGGSGREDAREYSRVSLPKEHQLETNLHNIYS